MVADSGPGPARLVELLAGDGTLDRVLAAVATVDESAPPERVIVETLNRLAGGMPDRSLTRGGNAPGTGGDEPSSADLVLRYVYGELGFTGDSANYYSPSNSLIHRVLERRRGIPLTLAAVAAEIGRRQGVELRLVGLPGHILLGAGSTPETWFDPFNGGARLSREDCRQLFARFHPIEAFQDEMLAPIDNPTIAARMLNNLNGAYARRGDIAATVPVLTMRAELPAAGPRDRLELVRALVAVGRFDQAAEQFELLIDVDPQRADAYRTKVQEFRAHRN
jgi:regulator of sirC expression with transglutaminase-like and TPR domain